MLLELNDPKALIIARPPPPMPDVDAWRSIARNHRCLVLAADVADFNGWLDLLGDCFSVYFWDHEAANEVAGNIRSAMEILDSQPYETVYVTFDELDLFEAVPTRVGTIQVDAHFQGVLPDIFCDNVGRLANVLENQRRNDKHVGYLGELEATMTGPKERWGGSGVVVSDRALLSHVPELDASISGGMHVGLLGRYFPPNGDFRYAKHQLSQRILKAKDGDQRARPLVKPLALGIKHFLNANAFNLVTRVPPKPSAERDSVGALLRAAANSSRYALSDLVLLDAIRCVRDYPPQKSRGSFERRVNNVDGVFAADRAVRGQHVLLVDDILTSGATLISCARALLDAGAASVGALVIGYNQNRIHRDAGFPCAIRGCVGSMNLRLSTQSGTAFWGCSRWREDGTGCKGRWFYRKGLRMYNMRNRMESIEVVPEIEF